MNRNLLHHVMLSKAQFQHGFLTSSPQEKEDNTKVLHAFFLEKRKTILD